MPDSTPFADSPVWGGIKDCIVKVVPSLRETEFTPDTRFDRLGLASIQVITITFEIEEMFGVGIVDEGLDVFETCGELEVLVRRLAATREVTV